MYVCNRKQNQLGLELSLPSDSKRAINVTGSKYFETLEVCVKNVITTFINDKRIVMWNLSNG